MDVWADKAPSILRRLLTAAVLFVLLLCLSCSPDSVLVISDPHIQALNEGKWFPGTKGFALRARLAGFRLHHEIADRDRTVAAILGESVVPPEMLIISPFNRTALNTISAAPRRIIIAGGYPGGTDKPMVEAVVPDRTKDFSDLGRLAAGYDSGTDLHGKEVIFALLNGSTEVRRKEINAFLDGFQGTASENAELRIEDLSESESGTLPDDFNRRIADVSLLVLLAGPENFKAMGASDEAALPVITESLSGSSAWKERIVASVEDDPDSMKRALLDQMKEGDDMTVRTYTSRLNRGKRYP